MIFEFLLFAGIAYVFLYFFSLTFSCGGYSSSCGLCPVGLIQLPVDLLMRFVRFVKDRKDGVDVDE